MKVQAVSHLNLTPSSRSAASILEAINKGLAGVVFLRRWTP
jgi:hypothetical protein